jgi:hypothetical protein
MSDYHEHYNLFKHTGMSGRSWFSDQYSGTNDKADDEPNSNESYDTYKFPNDRSCFPNQ